MHGTPVHHLRVGLLPGAHRERLVPLDAVDVACDGLTEVDVVDRRHPAEQFATPRQGPGFDPIQFHRGVRWQSFQASCLGAVPKHDFVVGNRQQLSPVGHPVSLRPLRPGANSLPLPQQARAQGRDRRLVTGADHQRPENRQRGIDWTSGSGADPLIATVTAAAIAAASSCCGSGEMPARIAGMGESPAACRSLTVGCSRACGCGTPRASCEGPPARRSVGCGGQRDR